MKLDADVDIDMADRTQLLQLIDHVPAAMRKVKPIRKHATGVHCTNIPYDPVHDMATIDYLDAEQRGYFKLDILNVSVYAQVRDSDHLEKLMNTAPDWTMLRNKEIVTQLVHLHSAWYLLNKLPEPIDSIPRLAMFLAIMRPAKKHLQGLSWNEVAKTVWEKDENEYTFKKSHSVAYATLIVVHMNLLKEQT